MHSLSIALLAIALNYFDDVATTTTTTSATASD